MSLCINPLCLHPDHPGNDSSRYCQSCGSDLVLQERYRVMRLISDKSGFGRVYEAYERSVPKILKVLKEVHNHHDKAIALFKQEAAVLSQLHHPGVPAIEPSGYFQFFPRGISEPMHCIIMEKIDGPNLREWMRQQGGNPISEKQAVNWMRQLTEILHLVHQKNYFHRDIKPENIMLRSNGQLVLVDFGAAREMTYTYLAQLGATGGVTRISSAGYTPPEQEKGQAVPQSDFYALGWTFIYLLTGKQPTDPDIYDSLNNEFHWRKFAPHLSPEFCDFIDRLIASRASDRPKNTQELMESLNRLSPSPIPPIFVGTPSSPPRVTQPQVTVVQTPTLAQTSSTLLQNLSLRQKWLVGGVAALLLGLAGYGGWQVYQRFASGAIAQQQLTKSESLLGHSSLINRVIFSNDGKSLFSGGSDQKIVRWDLATNKAARTYEGKMGFVNALALSGNGQILASGGADNQVILWDLVSGLRLHTLTGHTGPINDLLISPDGTVVSASADRTLRTWSMATGQPIHTLKGHTGFINAIAIGPDGQTVVTGGADPKLFAWNITTGQQLRTFSGYSGIINCLAITLDGKTLIGAGTDKKVYLWDMATGNLFATLTGHTGFVNTLSVRRDGKVFLTSDSEGKSIVWDLEKRQPIAILSSQGTPLDHVAVSPDWSLMATGKGFTDVRILKFPTVKSD